MPEKSLPLRPSVVCSPSRVRAMKPVMTSVASASRGMQASALARDSGQRTLGPSGAASIAHDLPRVDPVHTAGAPVPRAADSARTGASTRSRRSRRRGRGPTADADAHQPHGLQDAGDVVAVAAQLLTVFGGVGGSEQRVGDDDVALPNRVETAGVAVLLTLRGGDERQQRVGDASTRRQDGRDAPPRVVLEDPRDPLHAAGIGDARPAELVYPPGFQAR